MTASDRYIQRLVDPLIAEYLAGLPAIMLVGPRATGKTTTARRFDASTLRLDRASSADAVRADPDGALGAYDEPIASTSGNSFQRFSAQ